MSAQGWNACMENLPQTPAPAMLCQVKPGNDQVPDKTTYRRHARA
jgi:hypothetical protein